MTERKANTDDDDRATLTNLELANLTWSEYKYRHESCWNLIFKITLTTATLSIIPYLNNDIIKQARRLVFFTPLIGIAVSAIGGFRLYRELKLLDKIRHLHRTFQNEIYKKEIHDLKKGTHFTSQVTAYLFILTSLAVINFIIMLLYVP